MILHETETESPESRFVNGKLNIKKNIKPIASWQETKNSRGKSREKFLSPEIRKTNQTLVVSSSKNSQTTKMDSKTVK